MSRAMYDSVTAARLPANATLVACYIDGRYANEAAVRARCPKARIVRITVRGADDGHVCDVEPGDLTPAQGAAWAKKRLAGGHQPTIYCNLSTWPAVQAEVRKAGIAGHVSYWIAHYDGKAELIPGAVAKQYQERTDQNLDYSIAADYWPGVDPAPTPAPVVVKPQDVVTPTPVNVAPTYAPEETAMLIVKNPTGPDVWAVRLDLSGRSHIADQASLDALLALPMYHRVTLSSKQLAAIPILVK